eukprot:347408-Rhodomonas_salina.2
MGNMWVGLTVAGWFWEVLCGTISLSSVTAKKPGWNSWLWLLHLTRRLGWAIDLKSGEISAARHR